MTTRNAFRCTCGTGLKRKCPVKGNDCRTHMYWLGRKYELEIIQDKHGSLSEWATEQLRSKVSRARLDRLRRIPSGIYQYEKLIFEVYCECKKRGWL